RSAAKDFVARCIQVTVRIACIMGRVVIIARNSMTPRIPYNLSETVFDCIIVGAGINGAGIARDAAMRGLRVLMLDQNDLGSGTSSASTRLIHGGLRYLEHGEIGLVRESLRERETLLNIAPHLVKPLQILIPMYQSARRGRWTVRAGMFVYDLLSFDNSQGNHRMVSKAEVLQLAPALNPVGLLGGAIYFDAQVEFAERLVLENALSARVNGAVVINHARLDGLGTEARHVSSVTFTDLLTGEVHSAFGKFLINATGPWVDDLLQQVGAVSQRLIGGTKGSHIIVSSFPGAPATSLYVEAETDQRPFFIIPWNGKYLIGTTDIRYEGDLGHMQIGQEEIDYLLSETNRVIPTAGLAREHILYSYAGVRPLPFADDKDEQSITRRHFIKETPHLVNMFSIVGGKLTTYRQLAEEVVDLVFKKLDRSSPKCSTAEVPLPGAAVPDLQAFRTDFEQHSDLSPEISSRLLRIYGSRSLEILKLIGEEASLADACDVENGAIAAEVIFAFTDEMAQTLSDCLLRRTMVGLNSLCGLNAVEAAAGIARRHLGWSDERTAAEISSYRDYVSRFQVPGRGL
ncbi:MAG: glycerol-3-phosphate dehydrogenase, partial [Pyrinomonadaceae bacterium]